MKAKFSFWLTLATVVAISLVSCTKEKNKYGEENEVGDRVLLLLEEGGNQASQIEATIINGAPAEGTFSVYYGDESYTVSSTDGLEKGEWTINGYNSVEALNDHFRKENCGFTITSTDTYVPQSIGLAVRRFSYSIDGSRENSTATLTLNTADGISSTTLSIVPKNVVAPNITISKSCIREIWDYTLQKTAQNTSNNAYSGKIFNRRMDFPGYSDVSLASVRHTEGQERESAFNNGSASEALQFYYDTSTSTLSAILSDNSEKLHRAGLFYPVFTAKDANGQTVTLENGFVKVQIIATLTPTTNGQEVRCDWGMDKPKTVYDNYDFLSGFIEKCSDPNAEYAVLNKDYEYRWIRRFGMYPTEDPEGIIKNPILDLKTKNPINKVLYKVQLPSDTDQNALMLDYMIPQHINGRANYPFFIGSTKMTYLQLLMYEDVTGEKKYQVFIAG